jgi:hypothetical protein
MALWVAERDRAVTSPDIVAIDRETTDRQAGGDGIALYGQRDRGSFPVAQFPALH